MDFFLALTALVVLFPWLLLISLLVWIDIGSPILFVQKRPGLNEKIFDFYKFRTMTNKKDKQGVLLPDFARLTIFGKFLRSNSLDELPELLNILVGDMSIVGPRPLLVQYLSLYDEHQKKRHQVRPGLTGLAQVKGRNSISWEEKFKHDVKYLENISFFNDWKIIFETIISVLIKHGINMSDKETMKPFLGNIC